MIFNASAGTGKTYQVTELYSALVLGRPHSHLSANREPVDPRNILLMTFTENAASELRQEVSEKMIKVEREALQAGDDELGDCARRVLRSMPAANISTIHAFCAGILREHALEIGLSPNFQTLEEDARDLLLEEVLKADIFQRLETDPAFREFCSGVSVLGESDASVFKTLRALLEKAASRGLDLSDAEAMLPLPKHTVTREMFEAVHEELTQYDLPKTAANALDALTAFLSDFPNLGKLNEIKKFGQAKKVKHLSEELASLKDRFGSELLYEENVETFRAFARCLSGAARGFSEAKRLRDSVDFGDQLLMARDLLKKSSFVAPQFEWILVDEVQDTSRVQYDVIESLWGESTQLVICGDRKQSIYAWRSADPDVMPDLEKQMEARGDLKRIALKQSYRSKDRVIDAVNELFSGMVESYADSALEPVPEIGALTADQGEGPCVEFLRPKGDEEESATEAEMAAVARRICLLVDGDDAWRPKFGHDGKRFVDGEPVRYGDILILLKRGTHQPDLEKALRAEGVPYTSGGKGSALFEQQEVRDLLLFLQVLTQPFNDLALVGFLRSPFANVSDDEMVQLGWDGETFDHEILRTQFLESGSVVSERLLRYRTMVGEKLASQLIRELVEETAFDAHLAGLEGGDQKLANFKKALDGLRAAERGGQVLIGDVVRRFEKAIKTPPRNGAAEALLPDPDQDAVTLMTVHGAKGLTKRVCFVPDISFGGNTDREFASFSPEGALEMKLARMDGSSVKSPGWTPAREADKVVRELESINVFYVAMTRARDLVVLSGAGTKKPNGWLKLAENFLETAVPELLRRLDFEEILDAKGGLGEGVSLEALDLRASVVFKPLEIPEGLDRRPVTSLVEHCKPQSSNLKPSDDRRSFGTVGHAVLEELAKTQWKGDVRGWVDLLTQEHGDIDSDLLIAQVEAAREVLREETAGANALFAEHSFVFKRGNVLLDGSIDLLVQESSEAWKIIDYKFSNEEPEAVARTYSPQLEVYRDAVQALHPTAQVSAEVILIGESVKRVPVL